MKFTNAEIIESAEHWERQADEAEAQAAWDRERGIDLSPAGTSAGDHRAQLYRATGQALRLEASTGIAHCSCHLVPATTCPRKRP